METIFRSILLMQKRSMNGLYKRLRLSTKYILQRSLTLKGILIIDSYKLHLYKLYNKLHNKLCPYKLCLYKLRLYKLCLYKLCYKLRLYKLCLCKLYLYKLCPRKLRLTNKLDKNLRKNLRSSLRSILYR